MLKDMLSCSIDLDKVWDHLIKIEKGGAKVHQTEMTSSKGVSPEALAVGAVAAVAAIVFLPKIFKYFFGDEKKSYKK